MKLYSHFVAAAVLLTAPLAAQVSGLVLDSSTGNPIQGAIVTEARTFNRTTTDASGAWSLPSVTGSVEVVAAMKGYFNEGMNVTAPQTAIHLQLDPVIVGTNVNYPFATDNCQACHPLQYDQWDDSPMGLTGMNEWVYDLQSGTGTAGGMNGFVYTRDSVHLGFDAVGPCAACHQPENWVKNPGVGLEPIGSLSDQAVHSVSCEVCHKMADIDTNFLNSLGPTSPSVLFNLPNNTSTDTVLYGVLGDVSFEIAGLMRASYQPQIVAEMCAACHQYSNDHDEDGDHEEASSPEGQATYEEWVNSPYGDPQDAQFKTCVDCHMPFAGTTDACVLGLPPRPITQVRDHDIRGTTPQFLENAINMGLNVVDNGGTLAVQVDLTNYGAGHKVPTGVSPRNMVLIVEAWDNATGTFLAHDNSQIVDEHGGQPTFSWERYLGEYAGTAGKMYAKVANTLAGQKAPIFTEAETPVYDTRIAPLATDTTNYVFTVPGGASDLRVRARLIYRRAFKAIVDTKGWNKTGLGDPLADVTGPYFGHLMEEAEWTSGTPEVETFGTACAGLAIDVSSSPFLGNTDFAITLSGANPSVPAFVILGTSNTDDGGGNPLPMDLTSFGSPGCFLNVSINTVISLATDSSGNGTFPLPLVLGVPVGLQFYAQWGAVEPSLPSNVAFSDGISIRVTP